MDKYHLTILITRNIVQETLESYKERIDHINLYKMRSFLCCLNIVNDSYQNILSNALSNLSDEKERNEIRKEIVLMDVIDESDYVKYLRTGNFKMFTVDHLQLMLPLCNNQAAFVYKELGRFDEAIDLFKLSINRDAIFQPKVEIGCCEILKGNIESGLQTIADCENGPYLYLQVGRALFDVGRYEESKTYFLNYLKVQHETFLKRMIFIFDGLSKIIILYNNFSVQFPSNDLCYLKKKLV